ncbi:lipoprotein [Virgibacillus halodenitrificans]|uniref:lipoprotein n=1 Tax=Virgibacillus halodenitrificans TaxID=1482 RepID=UPI001F3EA0F1|nr:lipoprotein [Virgibacillus halodenitrificans]MCG1029298.1 lipoprotein [Virgibacillus halodenitrificans]
MKKVLFVLVSLLVLTACGDKVNENINEDMATDTTQIIDISDNVIKEERSLEDNETAIMDDYQLLYGAKYKKGDLTEEEERLYLLVRNMLDMKEQLLYKETGQENYKHQKNLIESVIKTGTIYD